VSEGRSKSIRESTDGAAGGFFAGLEHVFFAGAKEQFVGEDLKLVVKNGLAGDELFVHVRSFFPPGSTPGDRLVP
jgi:hypothetical protein